MKKLAILLILCLLLCGCAAKPVPAETVPAPSGTAATEAPSPAPDGTEPPAAESAADPATEAPETEPVETFALETEPSDETAPETELPPDTAPVPTEPYEPLFTEIRHDLITPTERLYIGEKISAIYSDLVRQLLFDRPALLQMTDSYDENLTFWTVFHQSPYAFLIKDFTYTSDHTGCYIEYAYSGEEQADIIAFIDGEYLTILNECVRPGMTDTEKVLSLYHYFGNRVRYNYEWYEAMISSENDWATPDIEVYEALKTNLGVCHSYSYLMQFALQQLDIDCWRITGAMADDSGFHMWIIAALEGEYYQFDVTWDSAAGDGTVGLHYFGMTDEERIMSGINADYRIGIDVALNGLPCTSDRFYWLRDVADYRVLGDGRLEVLRDGFGEWETVDIP